ncbi:MAG: hypothetical protein ACK2TU_08915, partial [Anaerolineales bacterium]
MFLILIFCFKIYAHAGPFDGNDFKGRIAYSADGNFNDEDDWAASAVALAIFAEFGVQEKLVHFDYNCILPQSNPQWEKEHEISIMGAIESYGYPRSIFYDCQKDPKGAINSIKDIINASSADNPLYFILAGPMEVPYLGIQKSDPDKRKYVYCISHSVWNDGYASADLIDHNKRDVIPQGINWVQIGDQNRFLSTSPFGRKAKSAEWDEWRWMQNSSDPKVTFLWDRLQATTRADCSDAGMAYFLMTGDEESEIHKLQTLLEYHRIPNPLFTRPRVRMECENFFELANYKVEYKIDRQVSQKINLTPADNTHGSIQTKFNEPYTPETGIYDVEVRYYDGTEGRSHLQLYVSDLPVGEDWAASADDNSWKSHTIKLVKINDGDPIKIDVDLDADESLKLDYIQLDYQAPVINSFSSGQHTLSGDLDDPEAML